MTAWTDRAACRGHDPEMWFPAATADPATEAFAICRACPVQAECLEHALDLESSSSFHGLYGIWGGTRRAERVRMLRDREQVTA